MNQTLEKDKEHLLLKFNDLMLQRGDKSKEEIMKQLFSEDISNFSKYKSFKNNKSTSNFKTTNMSKIQKLEEDKNKEDNDGYDDFEKKDDFFVTNIPKSP